MTTLRLGEAGASLSRAGATGRRASHAGSTRPSSSGSPLSPLVPLTMVVDDGSLEAGFGLNRNNASFPILVLNRFTPDPLYYPMVLNQISIQFPDPAIAGRNLTGLSVDLLVYEDPTGSGNPANSGKIYQHTVTVLAADGVTFSNYPVNISMQGPGDVYVGFSDTYNHGGGTPLSYAAPLDQDFSMQRSWVISNLDGSDPNYNDPGNNALISLIDNVGYFLAGNWVIRATAESPNGPTATPTDTPTPTPIPTVALVGHVTWDGPPPQPHVRQQLPLVLTLCVGGVPTGFAETTDSSGFFTVTASLPGGQYGWQVKGPKYLSTSGTLTVTEGATVQQEMGLMKAGDVDSNHNNAVNAADFNTLKGVFGLTSTVGDLNNDGLTNIRDFELLKGNFGHSGAPFACP